MWNDPKYNFPLNAICLRHTAPRLQKLERFELIFREIFSSQFFLRGYVIARLLLLKSPKRMTKITMLLDDFRDNVNDGESSRSGRNGAVSFWVSFHRVAARGPHPSENVSHRSSLWSSGVIRHKFYLTENYNLPQSFLSSVEARV